MEAILDLLLRKLTHISDGQPGGIQSQRSQLTYSNLITSSTHFVNSFLRADPGLFRTFIVKYFWKKFVLVLDLPLEGYLQKEVTS